MGRGVKQATATDHSVRKFLPKGAQ